MPPAGSAPSASVPPSASGAPASSNATRPPDAGAGPADVPPMKPIAASAMEVELREIGIDPRALPPLNKLEPDKLRKVMKKFTKALGVQCSHCHDTKDFHAPTTNKKIATHMWNDFTRGFALADEKSTLFCDSCHLGRAAFLDRRDLASLGDWMQANYEAKVTRADRKEHTCGSCHGDPFEGKILTKLWK
jgi:hypothetical protein